MLAVISNKVKKHKGLILDLALVCLAGLTGFALGRISRISALREPVRIIRASSTTPALLSSSVSPGIDAGGGVVASKGGTKYHYPWCSGASRISSANKITFPTIQAARAKGYTPASNCPGLE